MPETVYISSTYNDLKDFRRVVIDCVEHLNQFYESKAMEYYSAEGVHFVERCTTDVALCDVYILLLGDRYGYLPKGCKQSITEIEYETALASKKELGKPEILVFKVGPLCKDYDYKEESEAYIPYKEKFLSAVEEQLSPKPFDSKAELELHVAYALTKRIFRKLGTNIKIKAPSQEAICLCDRKAVHTSLRDNLLTRQQKKRLFFVQGDEIDDFPNGIVKRFARFSLGYEKYDDLLLSINSLLPSCVAGSVDEFFLAGTQDYLCLSPPVPSEELNFESFLEQLVRTKSNKIVLPFSYSAGLDEAFEILTDFLRFLDGLFAAYQTRSWSFELYAFIVNYEAIPDPTTLTLLLEKYPVLAALSLNTGKLTKVPPAEIINWIASFVTVAELAPSVYKKYFNDPVKKLFCMEEVNKRLYQMIDDQQNGEKLF